MPTGPGTRAPAIPLPPPNLRFMGESDELFVTVGLDLADLVFEWVGPNARILDVGSGYGRLAIGLMHQGLSGRYDGFDILPRHVAWCHEHLTPIDDRFRFHHVDIRNARYNPNGTIDSEHARFPVDGPYDGVALFSVFTHMDHASIARYLAEIRRVLAPGGTAITTFFLWDDARIPAITSQTISFPMIHELDRWTRYASETDPLHAIAYHRTLVLEMAAAVGLEVVEIRLGHWAGSKAPQMQDVVILRRPVRSTWGRLRHRLAGG